MNLWNTGVKNIASLVNGSKILDYVEALATGKKIGVKERAQLNNLFIDDVMAKRIYKEYQAHGLGKGAGESAGYERLRVARADNWTDSVARETYLSALQKDINITIVTPIRDQILLITNNDISVTMSDTAGTGTSTAVTSTAASGSTSGGSSGSGGSGSSY